MEAFLNSALDDCSKFIAEAVAVFNKKKLSSGIISYSLKLEKKISDISFQTLCNKINPTFLFENQKEEYSFIAEIQWMTPFTFFVLVPLPLFVSCS